VVTEFYSGDFYSLPPAEQLVRLAWADRYYRADPRVLAVLPFTLDPSEGWRHQDYTPAYMGAVLDYLITEKEAANPMPPTVLVLDWSKYNFVFRGDPNVDADQYDPTKWTVDVDWAVFVAECRRRGVQGVIVRLNVGMRKDPVFDRLVAALEAHGLAWGIYVVPLHRLTSAGPLTQATQIATWCQKTPPLGVWVDIEDGNAAGLPFAWLWEYLGHLDAYFQRPAGLYSGGPFMDRTFRLDEQRRLRGRPVWWAGYPNFITPAGWVGYAPTHHLHQFTASYAMAGLRKLCDCSRLNPMVALDVILHDFVPEEQTTMAFMMTLTVRDAAPELVSRVEALVQQLYVDVEQGQVGTYVPYGDLPAPPPPAPWWETKVPQYKLKATGQVVTLYNADGSPRRVNPMARTLPQPGSDPAQWWDVFERNGALLRVTQGLSPEWWVRAQEVEPA
jgi:hypothetical protein